MTRASPWPTGLVHPLEVADWSTGHPIVARSTASVQRATPPDGSDTAPSGPTAGIQVAPPVPVRSRSARLSGTTVSSASPRRTDRSCGARFATSTVVAPSVPTDCEAVQPWRVGAHRADPLAGQRLQRLHHPADGQHRPWSGRHLGQTVLTGGHEPSPAGGLVQGQRRHTGRREGRHATERPCRRERLRLAAIVAPGKLPWRHGRLGSHDIGVEERSQAHGGDTDGALTREGGGGPYAGPQGFDRLGDRITVEGMHLWVGRERDHVDEGARHAARYELVEIGARPPTSGTSRPARRMAARVRSASAAVVVLPSGSTAISRASGTLRSARRAIPRRGGRPDRGRR